MDEVVAKFRRTVFTQVVDKDVISKENAVLSDEAEEMIVVVGHPMFSSAGIQYQTVDLLLL